MRNTIFVGYAVQRMAQKYISMALVLVLVGLATPAFAGDPVNANPVPQKLPLAALGSSPLVATGSSFAINAGVVFAPPRPDQTQPGQVQPSPRCGRESVN
jgi:hypothetical protein